MSVSVVGIVFLALGAITILSSRRAFLAVLSASAAFVTTSAITVAGSSIPPFYVLAAMALTAAVISHLRGTRVGHPQLRVLAAFVAVSALLTFLGPALFAGLPVLDPRGGIDGQILDPTPLAYTAPMFAQLAYLFLAAGVVLYLAQGKSLDAGLLTPAFLVGSAVSALRLIPGAAPAIDGLFRNYASALYNPNETRHFGIFAEPSFLSVFSTAALTYAVFRFARTRGSARAAASATAILSTINLLASYSGTAALGVIVLVVIAFAYYGARFMGGRMKLNPAWFLAPLATALFLLIPNPATNALWATVLEKASSGSFAARTTSDAFSLEVLFQTYGLGVGLGANRPSSFLALLLSSVGLVGTLLFAVFVVGVISRARNLSEWAPTIAALIALLVTKVIAESALTTPAMWLALGALIYAGRPAADLTRWTRERSPLASAGSPSSYSSPTSAR